MQIVVIQNLTFLMLGLLKEKRKIIAATLMGRVTGVLVD